MAYGHNFHKYQPILLILWSLWSLQQIIKKILMKFFDLMTSNFRPQRAEAKTLRGHIFMVIEYIWKLKLFLKSVYKTTIVPKCAFWNSHFYKNQRPLVCVQISDG